MEIQPKAFGKSRSKYHIKIEEFEGPFDLLLDLVRTSEINIYDISISDITQRYLDYLGLLIEHDIDTMSEFVDMAATLILIKSRTMLPVEVDYEDREDGSRAQLIAKLLEYQKYKVAARLLGMRDDESILPVRKNSDPTLFDINDDNESNWKSLSIMDLVSAFAKVLSSDSKISELEISKLEYSVEDKIFQIFSIIKNCDSFDYSEIIDVNMPKLEIVCSFLAVLELVKKGVIFVKQHKIFGDIHIVKVKDYKEPEEITIR